MAERAAQARKSAAEKSSARDARGRYLRGVSGNARGRPPITPEQKEVRALAVLERPANVARLVYLRDHARDQWLQLEAARVLLLYSDGRPATAHIGGPLVSMNFGMPAPAPGELTPELAYRLMIGGELPLDPGHLAFSSRPTVIDAEPAAAAAPAAIDSPSISAPAAPIAAPAAPRDATSPMSAEDLRPQALPPAVQAVRDAWLAERIRGER